MLLLLAACSTSVDLDKTGGGGSVDGVAVSDLSARLHDTYRSVVYVDWTQTGESESAHVEYSVDDGVWASTPDVPGTEGEHEQIVLGVPYGMTVHWRVVVESGDASASTDGPDIDTESDPGLPAVTMGTSDESRWDPDAHFLLTSVSLELPEVSVTPTFYVVVMDRQGRYVWAHPADDRSWTLFAKPSRSGRNILYDDSLFWTQFDGGDEGMVHSLRLDGTVVHDWSTPGLDHAFDDLDDDTIAWTAQTTGDDVLFRRSDTGDAEELWTCTDWLHTTDLSGGGGGPSGCGCNSVSWDEPSDTYVLSLWTQEAVAQIDVEHDETLWYAGADGGGYSIDPSAVWIWEHEANLLDNGHLLLSSAVGKGGAHGQYEGTAAYEYTIDPDTESLQLVWSYESEKDWAAQYKGGAHRLAGGNTVTYYGSHPGVRELTPDDAVVWQLEFGDESWIGRSTWLDDLYAFVE